MSTEIVSVEQLQGELAPVVSQANALVISSPEGYQNASSFLKSIKAAQSKVTIFFAPMKKKAHEAWKSITSTESETLRPLEVAEKTVKDRMLSYHIQQEKIRMDQERKLQAEADAKARREREALEKKAASMKTDEKRQEYAEAAAVVVAPVVTVSSVKPVVSGQSIKKTWKAKVVNMQALIDAAATPNNPTYSANALAASFLQVNESAMNSFARSTKGAVLVPGVEMYEESSLSSSSK